MGGTVVQESLETNTVAQVQASFEALFLKVNGSQRFCLYYPAQGVCQRAVLIVPPFAEELNKSRRILFLQAQALSQNGCAVLSMDLFACGDSDGELRDASWNDWKQDLAFAYDYLKQRSGVSVSVLSLRLGALLTLDFMKEYQPELEHLIFWQPVLDGRQYLNQFFRLKLASDMLASRKNSGTQELWQALENAQPVEIAGYEIPPDIAFPIDTLNAQNYLPNAMHVHWMDVAGNLEMPPARKNLLSLWQQHLTVQVFQWIGSEYWNTQEVTVCQELMDQTTKILNSEDR